MFELNGGEQEMDNKLSGVVNMYILTNKTIMYEATRFGEFEGRFYVDWLFFSEVFVEFLI